MKSSKKKLAELLDPELLNSLGGLQLVSRVLSEELLAGANLSRKTGVGIEFSQYRSYEPGDDLRLLDWKLFARTDRYYVRQAVVYSNIHVRFVLDNTASMNYEEGNMSKLQLAKVLIATLAYLSFQSGDYFSFSDFKGQTTAMGNDQRHLNRILYLLINEKGAGRFPENVKVNRWGKTLQKELVIVFTDLYQDKNELSEFIKSLKIGHNEVVVFQITGEEEESFSFKKPVYFRDLETMEKVKTDPLKIKKQYMEKRNEYFRKISLELHSAGIILEKFRLGDDLMQAMRRFLTERNYLHL